MKIHRILLLIFNMILINSVYAQDFAPIGAEWHYTERHAFSGDETFLKISSVKDTVVNGKECRLIQKQSNPMCSGRPDIEFMYQEDSKVFFWDNTFDKFQILYDLTKVVNEFWIIEVLDERYTNNWDSIIYDLDTIKITVNSISSIEINGKLLKQLNVTYDVITEVNPYSYNSKIIEKIGDINYLFNYYPYSSWACDGNYAAGLRCYEDSELGLYSTGIADSCDYIFRWTSIQENTSNSDLIVFPNPTTGQLTISSESKKEYSVELTDLMGRILKSGKLYMNTQFDISVFREGVYILVIKYKDKTIVKRKIIKY